MTDTDLKTLLAELADTPEARPGNSLAENRARADTAAARHVLPDSVVREALSIDGLPAEWARPRVPHGPVVGLYLHGGAFCTGSIVSHRHVVCAIAEATDGALLSLDYRLAPEHPYPAALDDALAGYRFLLETHDPARIALIGDSAGGGLAAATVLAAREQGLPRPGACVMLSPWLDLTCSGDSYDTNADTDPFMNRDSGRFVVRGYHRRHDPTLPLLSPVFGDLSGFPPTLIQVSNNEALLDDARLFAERGIAAGAPVTLEVWADLMHVWHTLGQRLPEARQATQSIARFLRHHCDPAARITHS